MTGNSGRFDRRAFLRGAAGAAAFAAGAGSLLAGSATASAGTRPSGVTSADPLAADLLTWAPPSLNNPVTIELGTGATSNVLDDSTDYVIKLPGTMKEGRTRLTGGRNVVIIGGYIRIPSNDGTDDSYKGIYIVNNKGTVHIEGVHIDAAADGQGSAFVLSAPDSIVQIQNTRVEGLVGGYDQRHSDVITTWGGAEQLRIDKFTGSSHYEGLQIVRDLADIGTVTIKRTNLFALPEWYPGAGGGYMVWIGGTNSNGQPPAYNFSDVYVQPRDGKTLAYSVWPDANNAQNPVVVDSDGFAHWPTMSSVTGGVHGGTPPNGSYVPPGVAGVNYVSPGYL